MTSRELIKVLHKDGWYEVRQKGGFYMEKISCFAELEKEKDGGYSIWFPDFPGCVSCGSDIDEAREMAHEALELHAGGML